MFENIIFETDGPIARLTFNRPDKMNAVNNATVDELDQALEMVEKNQELRVLIITGAGKAFVAGADIGELDKRDTVQGRLDTKRRQAVYTRIEQLEIPSIAAINGFALGTGLEIALACTFRIASAKAKVGQPEVKLGIIPGAGGTQRLPRVVGMSRAMEMILTGDIFKADQALAMGLVIRVAEPDDLMQEVEKLAKTIILRPKLAIQYAKEAILKFSEGSLEDGLSRESYLHALSCGTEDKKEGVKSFLEKRDPVFKGR